MTSSLYSLEASHHCMYHQVSAGDRAACCHKTKLDIIFSDNRPQWKKFKGLLRSLVASQFDVQYAIH